MLTKFAKIQKVSDEWSDEDESPCIVAMIDKFTKDTVIFLDMKWWCK